MLQKVVENQEDRQKYNICSISRAHKTYLQDKIQIFILDKINDFLKFEEKCLPFIRSKL